MTFQDGCHTEHVQPEVMQEWGSAASLQDGAGCRRAIPRMCSNDVTSAGTVANLKSLLSFKKKNDRWLKEQYGFPAAAGSSFFLICSLLLYWSIVPLLVSYLFKLCLYASFLFCLFLTPTKSYHNTLGGVCLLLHS